MTEVKMEKEAMEVKPPYVSSSAIGEFFAKIKKINSPKDRITASTLKEWGISQGQEPALLSALRFLGLIDSKGYATEDFKKLQTVGETFKKSLEEVIKKSYSDFFALYKDLSKVTYNELTSFFTKYSVASRQKMVKVFGDLCIEAGLDSEAFKAFRKSQPRQESSNQIGTNKSSPDRLRKPPRDERPPTGAKFFEYNLGDIYFRGPRPEDVGDSKEIQRFLKSFNAVYEELLKGK